MSLMASQITGLTIVYSTVYWGADQKTSKLRVTGFVRGIHRGSPVTGEFPAQRASDAENVSIWWRHHGDPIIKYGYLQHDMDIHSAIYIGSNIDRFPFDYKFQGLKRVVLVVFHAVD